VQITEANQLLELEENRFIGETPDLVNSTINFNGKNNILDCEEDVKLVNSRIDFNFENSILYLSSNPHNYFVNISINERNVCFIGKNNFFNGLTTIVLSEAKNLVIGGDCLLSYNVIIRVSDGHAIYNSKSKSRLNYSKSIYIGDHVWLGQNAMIFKGSHIGSGSIIGAGSIVSNKVIPSNMTFAGSPVRMINDDVFWIPHSIHKWGEEEIDKMKEYNSDLFIFNEDSLTLDLQEIEEDFNNLTADEILGCIKNNFLNKNKNRFFIKNHGKSSELIKQGRLSNLLNRR
jgi:acetyltransferase-like isoleucine patch superfamily enzyme